MAIAAINSPSLTTLSGPTPTLRALQESLEGRKIVCRLLPTSHAFHSAMMDPIVGPFADVAAKVRQQKPGLPWISSFTGTWMNKDAAPEASYWAGQLRHAVRFGQAVETAIQHGATAFLEVGPGQALTQLVRQQPTKPEGLTLLASLGANDANPADLDTLLTSLGRLWLVGFEPDWTAFYAAEKRRRVALPTYPFERKSYWIEPPQAHPAAQREGTVAGQPSAVHGGGSPPLAPATAIQPTSPAILEDGRSNTCRVIERQVQIMAQQLEMLRRRAVATGSTDDGQ